MIFPRKPETCPWLTVNLSAGDKEDYDIQGPFRVSKTRETAGGYRHFSFWTGIIVCEGAKDVYERICD